MGTRAQGTVLAQPDPGEVLGEALGKSPFPWQERLLWVLLDGQMPRALDLPTGLGKTSVMAIWLVARACGASGLPRRLVYVVDRRAVVDQATEEAESLRRWVDGSGFEQALGLSARGLPISTLRGQFVDNREWLEDPTSTAIVVGTVDMVGSRLLFEGYGCSRKMRPYHAGMLGTDTLFAIDEAHLVPPFVHLLTAAADRPDLRGKEGSSVVVPPLKLLSLSATGRDRGDAVFRLDDRDRAHPVVHKRLAGHKRARIEVLGNSDKLPEVLAAHAWRLASVQSEPVRVLVFCNKRDDAEKARSALLKAARSDRGAKGAVPGAELFVGGRRICERTRAGHALRRLGFLAGSERPADHAFVFATSAGEVGVDLDADHMVADVVAWERMVQRLGRVNRRGERVAEVFLVADPKAPFSEQVQSLLGLLPADSKGRRDVGLTALMELRNAHPARVDAASTPEPLFPPLSRAVLEAWSLTSLLDHPGRPEVQPWLRGWPDPEEAEAAQTGVIWRAMLPAADQPDDPHAAAFFEAAPPHASERLDLDTHRVVEWLTARCKACTSNADAERAFGKRDVVGWCLDGAGTPTRAFRLRDLARKLSTRDKKEMERLLAGALLIVDAALAGLSGEGMLDPKAAVPPMTGDVGAAEWASALLGRELEEGESPPVTFRVANRTDAEVVHGAGWRERLRLPVAYAEGDEAVTRWLVVDKWRHNGATEEDRSTARRPQALSEHQRWTAAEAERIAAALALPEPLRSALVIAARIHDEGKRARRWQRAFNAPAAGGPFAKTRGPVNVALLGGYRHELGSLLKVRASVPDDLAALPPEAQALALHLVAAHHGFARPCIRTDGCDQAPPSVVDDMAAEIGLRFADLQVTWGPWGLAWLEMLLRAADQRASRRNDADDSGEGAER